MKILFLHSLAEPALGGGAEVILWEQMRGLHDAGHECVLLATNKKSGLQRSEHEGITIWKAGIHNVYWPYRKKRFATILRLIWHTLDSYNPWMQSYLREIVAREKPDVVSVHNLPGWSAASWSTLAKLGVPAVQVLHDHYPICIKTTMYKNRQNCTNQCIKCQCFRLPHRVLSRRVQAVIGVSKFIIDRHLSLGYFKDVPIQRFIHNARAPQALGIEGDPVAAPHEGLRFGFIGRLDQAKGTETLIDAFLAAKLSHADLWIAGSGRHHDEERMHNKSKNTKVKFLGLVAPRDFYPQVDVVVVPSLSNEALGMVVAEALAFGKPVIASRRGGIPEMIRDGENGLLFEPDAPGELESALKAMCDDNLRAKLTAQARPSSLPFTDIDRWVSTYEALYQEVIAAHKRNPLI